MGGCEDGFSGSMVEEDKLVNCVDGRYSLNRVSSLISHRKQSQVYGETNLFFARSLKPWDHHVSMWYIPFSGLILGESARVSDVFGASLGPSHN